jgi:hypothetical protein
MNFGWGSVRRAVGFVSTSLGPEIEDRFES